MTDKKLAKKRKQLKLIRRYIKQGYSGNKIQSELSKQGLGLRRKKLYTEIRSINKKLISEKKSKNSIPKKYRKKGQQKLKKLDSVYRMSLIINDIPLHSKPLARRYLGFRLTVFSTDKDLLIREKKYLKQLLVNQTNKFTHKIYSLKDIFENPNWSHKINVEYPTLINIDNVSRYNNQWFFRVENKGREEYSTNGRI